MMCIHGDFSDFSSFAPHIHSNKTFLCSNTPSEHSASSLSSMSLKKILYDRFVRVATRTGDEAGGLAGLRLIFFFNAHFCAWRCVCVCVASRELKKMVDER